MSTVDWTIVAVYLAYIVYSGVRFAKKDEGLDGFLLANRSLPWWAVGLSVMATQMSAITLVGTTGKAYEDGLRFIQFYFGLPIAMLIIAATLVPLYRRYLPLMNIWSGALIQRPEPLQGSVFFSRVGYPVG